MSPLALNAETFPRVTTVVDASLANAQVPLAVRALSSSRTLFLSGADILAYLRKLETAETQLHEVDFVALKSEATDGSATQAKPAERKEKKPEKDDAKIEGAVQIAVGVKKEVDFAAWYTNVGIMRSLRFLQLMFFLVREKGFDQGRYARLLQRQWMLCPQTVVVQHMGNHSR